MLAASLRLNLKDCMCTGMFKYVSETISITTLDMLEKTQWKTEFRNMTSIFSYISQWYFSADIIYPLKFSDVRNLNKGILFQFE